MALLLQENILPEGQLGLWRIEESEEWFRDRLELSRSEHQQLERLRGRRRAEWLAARQLVHQMSGRRRRGAFLKDQFGKPQLENSPYHISISHSHGMAAAIASPFLVGIDVQLLVPKLARLARKYMRPEEMECLAPGTGRLPHLHVFWGAKEALYKAYGRRALDFCQHIKVRPFRYQSGGGRASAVINKGDFSQAFELHYRMEGQYMLVYGREIRSTRGRLV